MRSHPHSAKLVYQHQLKRQTLPPVIAMIGKTVLPLFLVLPQLVTSIQQCYRPDGIPVADEIYQPCILIKGVESMCCRINDVNPDECLPNGLCSSNKDPKPYSYWRDFCTDRNWESPNCLPRTICNDEVRLKDALLPPVLLFILANACPYSTAKRIL